MKVSEAQQSRWLHPANTDTGFLIVKGQDQNMKFITEYSKRVQKAESRINDIRGIQGRNNKAICDCYETGAIAHRYPSLLNSLHPFRLAHFLLAIQHSASNLQRYMNIECCVEEYHDKIY